MFEMIVAGIELPLEKIAEFCMRNYIRKLPVFGSALTDEFRPDSDLDILVEFDPEHVPGFDFFGMADEFIDMPGRKEDLNTEGFISRYFRDLVLESARLVYEKP
ncbi:MAG: nucleotidyltransferase domain-containing protein [bacterium]|jgi:hypothetical protein